MIRRFVLVAMLVAAGCSSSADDEVPAPTTAETVVGDETSTTEATTSTTVEATTSTSTSSTSTLVDEEWTAEELEVIDAYREYQDAWELAAVDWDQAIEAIGQTATDSYAEEVVGLFESWSDGGLVLSGERIYEVASVEFPDQERAVLVDCGLDRFELVDTLTSEVVTPSAEEADSASLFFVREEGRWLLDGRRSGESC